MNDDEIIKLIMEKRGLIAGSFNTMVVTEAIKLARAHEATKYNSAVIVMANNLIGNYKAKLKDAIEKLQTTDWDQLIYKKEVLALLDGEA